MPLRSALQPWAVSTVEALPTHQLPDRPQTAVGPSPGTPAGDHVEQEDEELLAIQDTRLGSLQELPALLQLPEGDILLRGRGHWAVGSHGSTWYGFG